MKFLKNRKKFIPIERINLNCQMYKPKINNYKRLGFLGFAGLCIFSPGTNWLIPVALKGIHKINPLWWFQ